MLFFIFIIAQLLVILAPYIGYDITNRDVALFVGLCTCLLLEKEK